MFDRASKKLGLEVAVLGGDVFRRGMAAEGDEEESVDRPSKAEMENLLKKGAYALMEDDVVCGLVSIQSGCPSRSIVCVGGYMMRRARLRECHGCAFHLLFLDATGGQGVLRRGYRQDYV